MRKILFTICFLFMSINAYALDWDFLNNDCSSLAAFYTGATASPSTITQATFDSKSTCRFYAPSNGAGTYSQISWDYPGGVTPIPTTHTFETKVYIDSSSNYSLYIIWNIHTGASPWDTYRMTINGGETRVDPAYVRIRVNNTPTYMTARLTDNGEDHWYTLRATVESGRKMTMWVNDRCIFADVTISGTSTGSSWVTIYKASDGANTFIGYLDYIKIDSTPEHATTESPLKIGTENLAVRPYQLGTGGADNYVATEKFKIYGESVSGNDEVLEVPAVATTDDNASKVRIYDGSTIKALMKLPT